MIITYFELRVVRPSGPTFWAMMLGQMIQRTNINKALAEEINKLTAINNL